MQTRNSKSLAALAAFMLLAPVAIGAEDPPPYPSATEAYRQGVAAIKSGHTETALPALTYAAERGVLGAELKLARAYAHGEGIAKDDGKAFSYFQQIADQHAEIAPSSPVAKYVAEAFVALGQYYLKGIPEISVASDPDRAAGLFRHAASYFGDANAQYQLGRLYLSGDGVEKDVGLAANWLASAAKKQNPEAQAKLGELLLGGNETTHRPARGLALIMLAHENAKARGNEPEWIEALYDKAMDNADAKTRKEAQGLMPAWGGSLTATPATMPLPDRGKASAELGQPAPAAPGPETANAEPEKALAPPSATGVGFDGGATAPKP